MEGINDNSAATAVVEDPYAQTSTDCMLGMVLGGFQMLHREFTRQVTAHGEMLRSVVAPGPNTAFRSQLETSLETYRADAEAAQFMQELVATKIEHYRSDEAGLRAWLAQVLHDGFDWRGYLQEANP